MHAVNSGFVQTLGFEKKKKQPKKKNNNPQTQTKSIHFFLEEVSVWRGDDKQASITVKAYAAANVSCHSVIIQGMVISSMLAPWSREK